MSVANEHAFAETVAHASDGADGAAPAPPVAGSARYERGTLLGAGGMGRVLAATDRQFSRSVAIKELLDPGSASLRKRFAVEAAVTANLEHPGIPPVHERGVDEQGKPFYAMRLVQGRTLASAIDSAGSLADRLKLVPAIVRAAQTLAYAHERGVVHRDIKPENVILGRHGETVVLDWGIAKLRGFAATDPADPDADAGDVADGATRVGTIVGTPAYMAPEQADGDPSRIDERTDVFALGALLYQVLSGRAPFVGPTFESVVGKAKAADYPPVADVEPGAPPALVAICTRAMAKDPDGRFRTAAELADALESAFTRAIASKESRAIQTFVGVVSGVVLLAAVAGAVVTWRRIPSLREMGAGIYPVLVTGLLAGTMHLLELATRGRYRLSGLALAFTATSFVGGCLSTSMGLLNTLRAAMAPEVLVDAASWREVVTVGTFESLGSFMAACVTGGLLVVVGAIVNRSVARRAPSR